MHRGDKKMSGKRILKAIGSVLSSLLFIVLLLTLFLVISTKASGGEPNLFGYQLKAVLSGSMEPEIQTGSIISIKEVDDPTAFQKDDVITYITEEDVLVTHRVMEVQQDGEVYVTKGDANDAADINPVMADNIVGSYTGFTIPYVGYVMNFANTNEGAALLLIIPGVLLLGYSVITIWRAFREIDKEKKSVETDTN